MLHRLSMWVAVASLTALAVVSGTSLIVSSGISDGSGWTFYTPNSQPSPSLVNVAILLAETERVLLPLAAIASAAYIYLSHRGSARPRGFDVELERPSGGR